MNMEDHIFNLIEWVEFRVIIFLLIELIMEGEITTDLCFFLLD
jgi:hypothetical protein